MAASGLLDLGELVLSVGAFHVVYGHSSATGFAAELLHRGRLAASARAGGHGLDELQRQFADDRLLARAFSGPEADRWVLKGAGPLLARLPDARHSRDIDPADERLLKYLAR